MEKYKYMVQTRCMTFNHAPYIEDTMNGFCMQKTSFPFVCVIVDDDSKDGEPEVIEKYLQEHFNLQDSAVARREETDDYRLVFAQHKTNKNCYFVVLYLKYNHFLKKDKKPYYEEWTNASKYIAMCEGDDYWTDPLKLQKQVDFLESHPDFSMCCHRAKVLSNIEEDRELYTHLEEREYRAYDIYKEWLVPTCSVMYRAKALPAENIVPPIVYGDIYMFLRLAENGRIYNLNFEGSVYRRNSGGISQKVDVSLYIRLLEQYKFMEKRFPQPELVGVSREMQDLYLKCIISTAYFPERWKYRLQYMQRHPQLFFSKFGLVTLWQIIHKPKYAKS